MLTMLKTLLAGAAVAATLAFAGQASALTYTTQIEHANTDGVVDGSFGQVTIDELDANTLQLTVELFAPLIKIVDTGNAHVAFAFNMSDTPNSTVQIVTPVGGGSYSYLGEGSFKQAPFGNFKNAFACCGQGSSNGQPAPFVFKVTNTGGLTFAGVGATYGVDGRLLTTGTGNRLASNAGGWWFGVDTSDGTNTGAKAARDAFLSTMAVPEPTSWALMILGFGATGAMLRRRQAAFA
jgi:hypothetical protein